MLSKRPRYAITASSKHDSTHRGSRAVGSAGWVRPCVESIVQMAGRASDGGRNAAVRATGGKPTLLRSHAKVNVTLNVTLNASVPIVNQG